MPPSLTDGNASQDVSQATLTFRPKLTRDDRSLGSTTFTELPPPALQSDTHAQSAGSEGPEDLAHETSSRLPDSTDDDPDFGSRLSEAGMDHDDDAHDAVIPLVERQVSFAEDVEEIPSNFTRDEDEPQGDRIFPLVPKGHQEESTSAATERASSALSRGRSSAATPRGILKVRLPKVTPPKLDDDESNDQDPQETEWASDVAEASGSDEDHR